MTRAAAVTLGAALAVPLLTLACTRQGPHAFPAPATPTPTVTATPTASPTPTPSPSPSPSPRASRSRTIAPPAAQPQPVGLPVLMLRIRSCESGANGFASHGWAFDYDYTATNPASTASGAWQFLNSTFRSVTGLPGRAKDYSSRVQDDAALKLYREQGSAPWAASAGCWSR